MRIMLLVLIMLLYLIARSFFVTKHGSRLRTVLTIMDHLDDETAFYNHAEEIIQGCDTPEYMNKALVLKMFGDAYFRRGDLLQEDLEKLQVDALYNVGGKINPNEHEDSWFYLFLAIPNKLYHTGSVDLIAPLYDVLDKHAEVLDQMLVVKLGREAKKFYEGTDDLGAGFFQQLLDGDYPGYRYNKHLIGIYKSIAEAFLTRIALNEGKGIPEENLPGLRVFQQSTLGNRWLKELGIELPAEPEESPEPEEIPEPEETAEEPEAEESTEEDKGQ